jgi:hypothetical protein
MWRKTRWPVTLLLTASLITAAPTVGTGAQELPRPIDDAVRLLGWSAADVPKIELVTNKPRDVSSIAEAWVRFTVEGCAVPIIYVWTGSEMFREAVKGDYQARVRLAGVLAHERWHVRHGRDHVGAYNAQLSVMEYLGADSLHLTAVRKALAWAQQQAEKSARH